MQLTERNIQAGDFNYGERIQLARIFGQKDATDYKIIADTIECLHGERPSPREAADLVEYVMRIQRDFAEWMKREATEFYIPPTAEEVQAGIDKMTEECGDMGTLVSLAEKFQCPFEQIYKMPYTDVFTILKIQTARAKYERRLADVYSKKNKAKA